MRWFYILSFVLFTTYLSPSCEKLPGIGGNGSIQGKVIYNVYNKAFTVLLGTTPAKDVDVYIQFGSNSGVDSRLKTDFEGNFEIKYLYPGKYSIFIYGKDKTQTTLDGIEVVKIDVILKKNEHLDLGEIFINTN